MAKLSGCFKIILGIIFVPMVLASGWWFLSNLNRVTTHEEVIAVVVDLVASTDSDGDLVYAPVYEYRVDGELYQYESRVSYGGLLVPDIGDRKTLLYDPGNPNDARVRNIFILLIVPLLVLSIPLLVVLVLLWSAARRRRRETEVPTQLGQTSPPPWASQTQSAPSWDPPADMARSTIEALFMGTEPSQMDAQGKIRYRVKARAEIDGVLHRFRSEWLNEDPTLYYMEHGNKVEVHVDPADPTSYEVVLPPAQ